MSTKPMAVELGNRLREIDEIGASTIVAYRRGLGMTQSEFGAWLGYTNINVSKIENGHTRPFGMLARIAAKDETQ